MGKPNSREALLQQAAQSAAAGDWTKAANALRAGWNAAPHAAIARALFSLGPKLGAKPVTTPKVSQLEEKWLGLLASEGASALFSLVATPWPRVPRAAKARIAALSQLERDPLIGVYFTEPWYRKLYESNQGDVALRQAFKQLLKWKDPLLGEVLEDVKKRLTRDGEARIYTFETLLAQELPKAEPLSEAERKALAAFDTPTSAAAEQSLEQLYEAVYRAPGDDGPRAVLADFLTEQSDPRGEFIALQLAKRTDAKAHKRERELLRQHGAGWLKPLEPFIVTDKGAYHFARGFLGSVLLRPDAKANVFAAEPAWATIETLRLPQDFRFEPNANLKALKALHRLQPGGRARLPSLEAVTLDASAQSLSEFNLSQAKRLAFHFEWGLDLRPKLEALLDTASSAPWFKSVEVLCLPGGVSALAWGKGVLKRLPTISAIALSFQISAYDLPSHWEAVLTRDGALVLRWHGRSFSGPPPEEIGEVLAKVGVKALSSLTVEEVSALTKEQREAVEAALKEAIGTAAVPSTVFGQVW